MNPESPKKIPGIHPDDLARIEHEMRIHEKDFRMLDETYNKYVMALTIARGYGNRNQGLKARMKPTINPSEDSRVFNSLKCRIRKYLQSEIPEPSN